MKNRKVIQGVGLLLVVIFIILIPYFCIFNGGLSSTHSFWADFGSYLSGVAAILNVIVFTILTLIIHSIDCKRQDAKQKRLEEEFKSNQEKEIFRRFLGSYEKIIHKLYQLKSYSASICMQKKDIKIDDLLKYYEDISSLKILSLTYINKNNEIAKEIEKYMDRLKKLIEYASANKSMLQIESIKNVHDGIDPLIATILKTIKKQIYHG